MNIYRPKNHGTKIEKKEKLTREDLYRTYFKTVKINENSITQ